MKRLIATIAALFIFLGVAFARAQHKIAQAQKMPVVGILQTLSHPSLDQIHQGIIAGLKQEGYVNGKNMRIDFQNAQGDQSNLKSMSDRFNNRNAAVTVGIATPAVQSLANEPGKTPVVMGGISDPLGTGLVKSLKRPGGRVTGTKEQEPIGKQLRMMKQFMPHLRRVGVIYTSSDDSSTSEYKEFRKLAAAQGIKVKAFTISSTNDIAQVAQTMAGQVQAVYVPTDNTVASGFSTLVEATNAAKIPVFPAVANMVKSGGVATISSSQYDMGVLTGRMTARILKGEKPETMSVQRTHHFDTTINAKQAERLGLTVPAQVEHAAQKKGEIIK